MRRFAPYLLAFLAAAIPAGAAEAAPAAATLCQQERAVVQPIVVRHLYIPGHPGSAQKAVGIVVAVDFAGQPCFFGYGSTQLGTKTAPTRNSIFEIGSVTKTFTGTMLALRQVYGRDTFSAWDSVDTSQIPCAGPNMDICLQLTNGMEAIRYFQLATFTGGIPDYPPDFTPGSAYPQAAFIRFLNNLAAPPDGLPAPYKYSNAGYGLLGEILMSLDGYTGFDNLDTFRAQYDEWIKHAITRPLGMDCTGVDVDVLPQACAVSQELATGYDYDSGCGCYQAAAPPHWNPLGPSGQLRSTAADMARYMGAYLGRSNVGGRTVPHALRWAMRIAGARTYVRLPGSSGTRQGYAWVWHPASTGTVDRPAAISKDGAIAGFSSCVFVSRAAQLGVTLMANSRLSPAGLQCLMTEAILDGVLALQQ